MEQEVEYRSRIIDHDKHGRPVWNAAASACGRRGYGAGASEQEARRNAAADLLQRLNEQETTR